MEEEHLEIRPTVLCNRYCNRCVELYVHTNNILIYIYIYIYIYVRHTLCVRMCVGMCVYVCVYSILYIKNMNVYPQWSCLYFNNYASRLVY